MCKMYECIVDDGKEVFKTVIIAKNKKELLDVWGGNGKFEKIADVTAEYFNCDIKDVIEMLEKTLQRGGYGLPEQRLICYLVEEHLKTVKR